MIHITVGSEDWHPTSEELRRLAEMFSAAEDGSSGGIVVTRPDVSVEEIGVATQMELFQLLSKSLGLVNGKLAWVNTADPSMPPWLVLGLTCLFAGAVVEQVLRVNLQTLEAVCHEINTETSERTEQTIQLDKISCDLRRVPVADMPSDDQLSLLPGTVTIVRGCGCACACGSSKSGSRQW